MVRRGRVAFWLFVGMVTTVGSLHGMVAGGYSALVSDGDGGWLALSDDKNHPRIYHLAIPLSRTDGGVAHVTGVTPLRDEMGEPLAEGTVDPEGLALLPPHALLVSSEGFTKHGVPPRIWRADRKTGRTLERLPLPPDVIPDHKVSEEQTRGVLDNYGFEGLTLCPDGRTLLAATEAPLKQDGPWPAAGGRGRVLVYDVKSAPARLTGEHRYPLQAPSAGAWVHGLTAMLCLDDGRVLTLERSWGRDVGFDISLFLGRLPAKGPGLVEKKLLARINDLGVRMDNFEGLAPGPRLPDGRHTVLIISDDNFLPDQVSEVVWVAWRDPG
ncbi:MAG: esterase-like activity of phytase family protein [Myxococcota bacterium]